MKVEKNEQFPVEVEDFMIGDGRNTLLIETAERRSRFADRNKTGDQS